MTPFGAPWPVQEGIVLALSRRPRLPPAQRSNFWRLTAALYEPLWRHRSLALLTRGKMTTAQELSRLVAWVAPKPGELILDAGCSAGLYARTLLKAAPGVTVHALDMSPAFLRQAGRYAARDGVAPVLVCGDITALPYRDRIFDAVVCGGTPNELLDLPLALSELARVLKPGGRLWLLYITPAASPGGRALQALLRLAGLRFIAPDGLTPVTLRAGLTLEQADTCGVVAMALYRRKPD